MFCPLQKLADELVIFHLVWHGSIILVSTSIATHFTSFGGELDSSTNCNNFADNLSVRAASAGPKIRFFNLCRFAFFELARALFAIKKTVHL